MAEPGWFEKRKLAKDIASFQDLVARSETQAALDLYEAQIAPFQPHTERSLRATVHLLRWLRDGEPAEVRAVELLAAEAGSDGLLARTALAMRQQHTQRALARALHSRAPDQAPPEVSPAPSPEAAVLEGLARAVLLALGARGPRVDPRAQENLARQVGHLLPPARDLSGAALHLSAGLQLWVAWCTRDDMAILRTLPLATSLDPQQRGRATLVAIHRWGKESCRAGRARDCHTLVAQAARAQDARTANAMVVAWVLGALGHTAPDPLVGLVDHAVTLLRERLASEGHPDPAIPIAGLHLCKALVWFDAKDHARGREALEMVLRGLRDARDKGAALEDLAAVCWTLDAFSHLAASEGWTLGLGAGEDERREARVQNQALWKDLREHLAVLAGRARRLSPRNAWRADLLDGLVAFVEPSRLLEQGAIGAFGVAAARFTAAGDFTPFERLRAALLNRSQATSQAMALLQAQAWSELADLHHAVLAGLGSAIPPLVRMSVALALWDAGLLADPLPALRRAGEEPGMAERAEACEAAVQARRLLVEAATQLRRAPQAEPGPSLEPLDRDAGLRQVGALAQAVLLLRQGRSREALERCPLPTAVGERDRASAFRIRLRAAWQADDVGEFHLLLALPEAADGSQAAFQAIEGKTLLTALAEGRSEPVDRFLARDRRAAGQPAGGLIGVVVRLLETRNGDHAALLLQRARAPERGPAREALASLLPLLEGMVAAGRGQYGEAARHLGAFAAAKGQAPALGDRAAQERARGWARYLVAAAHLGQVATDRADLRARWPSAQRELVGQAEGLDGSPALRAYGFLIRGLVVFLSSDLLVDQATVDQLNAARGVLALGQRASFVEEIVGRLVWRGRILAEFWSQLERGALKECRAIYQRELVPAFAHRMPPSVRLGMLLVEWDEGAPAPELLRRLDELQQDAPGLSRALCDKVRGYIQDGTRIRELTRLVVSKDFAAVVGFVRTTRWAGMEEGSMPVPAAIALLYALHRTEKTAEALRLGEDIERAGNLPRWVLDHAALLLGYLRFQQKDFDGAVKAFERVSSRELLGHDVDRYWAAGHFSRGLELLAVQKPEQAFDAFARAVTKRGAVASNVDLAPLFVHFGLKNMEARAGSRSLQAFALLEQSLAGAGDAPLAVRNRLLAALGRLLCQALLAGAEEQVGSADFLALAERVRGSGPDLPGAPLMLRSLHQLAICQELRRTHRAVEETPPPREARARERERLRIFLLGQLDALDALGGGPRGQDKVGFALRGLIDLLLVARPDVDKAVAQLGQALREGLSSQRLQHILGQHREARLRAARQARASLDLFEQALAQGWTDHETRAALVRSEDVRALYALNKDLQLEDLGDPRTIAGVEMWLQRLGDLEKRALEESERAVDDGLADELRQKALLLQAHRGALAGKAAVIAEIERALLLVLARGLRYQLPDKPLPTNPRTNDVRSRR